VVETSAGAGEIRSLTLRGVQTRTAAWPASVSPAVLFKWNAEMNIFRRRLLKLLTAALASPAWVGAQPGGPSIRIALIEGLSGPFGNTGEAVYRNLLWAVERVNARGGVKLPGGHRMLGLERYDSKGQNEEGLAALRSAIDDGIQFVVQGNSSSVAAVLIDALNKHNEREPGRRVLFLNYSAVDPVLTNEKCSFWHFRFDAHADMRMAALMEVIRDDRSVKSVYLIGQDYSFGQSVLREARRQLGAQRPDMQIVGDELHPVGAGEGLSALRRQDQVQWRAGRDHRQLGQ
jgi:branched-chain amino acid transport system substrate-binding protein